MRFCFPLEVRCPAGTAPPSAGVRLPLFLLRLRLPVCLGLSLSLSHVNPQPRSLIKLPSVTASSPSGYWVPSGLALPPQGPGSGPACLTLHAPRLGWVLWGRPCSRRPRVPLVVDQWPGKLRGCLRGDLQVTRRPPQRPPQDRAPRVRFREEEGHGFTKSPPAHHGLGCCAGPGAGSAHEDTSRPRLTVQRGRGPGATHRPEPDGASMTVGRPEHYLLCWFFSGDVPGTAAAPLDGPPTRSRREVAGGP